MPAKVIRLVPRSRPVREEEPPFAYTIQAEANAVRVILGTNANGVELGLSPDDADTLAADIHLAAEHARKAVR